MIMMQKPIAPSFAQNFAHGIGRGIVIVIAVVIAALCLTVPVIADDATPDSAGGRYMFSKQSGGQANGYLRLDTQTGEVALCSQKTVGWACEAAPEDRAALENEIARLQAENAALKKDILAHGMPLPSGIMPEPPAQNGDLSVHLPSDADIDRMVAFVGHVWHRLVDAVERAQKQVLNKS
jgi:hypothetical protein